MSDPRMTSSIAITVIDQWKRNRLGKKVIMISLWFEMLHQVTPGLEKRVNVLGQLQSLFTFVCGVDSVKGRQPNHKLGF